MEFKNTKYSNISIVRISIVQILKHKGELKFPGTLRNQSIKWIVILNKKYEKIWKIGSFFIKKDFYIVKGRKYEWIQH